MRSRHTVRRMAQRAEAPLGPFGPSICNSGDSERVVPSGRARSLLIPGSPAWPLVLTLSHSPTTSSFMPEMASSVLPSVSLKSRV
eukprot:10330133-Alexandrium_andersonii.AAC.1